MKLLRYDERGGEYEVEIETPCVLVVSAQEYHNLYHQFYDMYVHVDGSEEDVRIQL